MNACSSLQLRRSLAQLCLCLAVLMMFYSGMAQLPLCASASGMPSAMPQCAELSRCLSCKPAVRHAYGSWMEPGFHGCKELSQWQALNTCRPCIPRRPPGNAEDVSEDCRWIGSACRIHLLCLHGIKGADVTSGIHVKALAAQ